MTRFWGSVAIYISTSVAWVTTSPAQEPLETSLVQTSKSVLPLQAVRFQMTWKNVREKEFRPRVNLDRGFMLWEIKRPADAAFTRFKWPVLDASGVIACGVRPAELDAPISYKSGHQLSVSDSMAAEWEGTYDGVVPIPLFPKPGTYLITVRWEKFGLSGQDLTDPKPIRINVQTPQGDDLDAWKELANDRELLQGMLSPISIPRPEHWVPKEPQTLVPKLKAFIAKHMNSTYSDYARFALARATTGLEFLEDSTKVERVRKQTALALLQGIDVSNFAYGPHVLVMQRELYYDIGSPESVKRTNARLDLLFPDDIAPLEH
jgi:hypothetical protein